MKYQILSKEGAALRHRAKHFLDIREYLVSDIQPSTASPEADNCFCPGTTWSLMVGPSISKVSPFPRVKKSPLVVDSAGTKPQQVLITSGPVHL